MRLTDLEPRWLDIYGTRIGFMFRSPAKPDFWQTCMFAPTAHRVQRDALMLAGFDEDARHKVQHCNPSCSWTATTDDFATMSVTPSLDGSAGGLWHGFITEGEIN